MIYGKVVDQTTDKILDDGFAVRMEAPHSYTGEEVVEIQVHGSPVTLQKIVSLCTIQNVRLAQPGEFTKRAFLHGKIDLVQAEAVAELIEAQSEAEASAARKRLEGKLSNKLLQLREDTVALLAEVEADVDFPEEDLPVTQQAHYTKKIKEIQALASSLRKSYEANQKLHDGFTVTLAGRPNVGKSSLFNMLLQNERAIVTPIEGTTRDILREEIILDGRRVRLIDTAGLRPSSSDAVERIGIERASEALKKTDLTCLVIDASEGLTPEEGRSPQRTQPRKNLVHLE